MRWALLLCALGVAGAASPARAAGAAAAYRTSWERDAIVASDVALRPLAADSTVSLSPRRLWLSPATPDPLFGFDKLLHASVSYGAFLTFRLAEDSSTQAALSAFGLGVAKEAHDVWLRAPGPTQGASWRDLVADAAGVAAGVLAWKVLAP